MNFNEYQQRTNDTAVYPNKGNNYVYTTLGLCGESGEIAEKIKKIIRDNKGIISDEKRQDLGKELGDVLWYVSQCCTELGLKLDTIAEKNIAKLKSRKERGVIQGSGDNR